MFPLCIVLITSEENQRQGAIPAMLMKPQTIRRSDFVSIPHYQQKPDKYRSSIQNKEFTRYSTSKGQLASLFNSVAVKGHANQRTILSEECCLLNKHKRGANVM